MALPENLKVACKRIAEIKVVMDALMKEGNSIQPPTNFVYVVIPHVEISGLKWTRSHLAEKRLGNSQLISEIDGVIVLESDGALVVDRDRNHRVDFELVIDYHGLSYESSSPSNIEGPDTPNDYSYSIKPEIKITFSVKMREDGDIDVFCRNGGGDWGNRAWTLTVKEATNAWFRDFLAWMWSGHYPSQLI